MTTIVNKTPHKVCILVGNGNGPRTIEPTFPTPRRSTSREALYVCDGIPIDTVIYGDVVDLPPPQAGVCLIVSMMVAQAFPNRTDLFVPGEAVRGASGAIFACLGLSRPY